MFRKKSVLVLGAGASNEVKLPLGSELTKEIAQSLSIYHEAGVMTRGDPDIYQAMRMASAGPDGRMGDINAYLHAAWHIRDAMPQAVSIDSFLESHPSDVRLHFCSKVAVVQAILKAERRSLLYVNTENSRAKLDLNRLSDTWYLSFWHLASESCQTSDISERLASVDYIVFNYDRCFEQFVYHSLQNYYRLSPSDAASIVNSLTIYHPYGVVGALPWQTTERAVEFGAETRPRDLIELAKGIKTFSEGTNIAESDISAIRASVGQSDILVFLGFAFHRMNLEVLRPSKKVARDVEIYATAFKLSDSDCTHIKRGLLGLVATSAGSMHVSNNLRCVDLFRGYRRALSFS